MNTDMIIKYFIDDQEVSDKPSNGEVYTEKRYVDGQLAVEIHTQASTPEFRLMTKQQEERDWRNSEISIVSRMLQELGNPYTQDLQYYMQQLRDYPQQEDFPNGTRPERPLTVNGQPIII